MPNGRGARPPPPVPARLLAAPHPREPPYARTVPGTLPLSTEAPPPARGSPGERGAAVLTDVAALSHEISEWGYDPFVDNYVNPWEVAGEPQYGCSNVLETGDPLVGVDFAAGSTNPDPGTGPAWHLQDEAFLWWFARNPTQASNHEYSYIGTFTSPAATC
jgi:hypothetical protein